MKNHRIDKMVPFSFLLVYLLILGAPVKAGTVLQSAHIGDEAKEVIKRLWSEDDATSRQAKREIRKIGLPALEPLLELLETIKDPAAIYTQRDDEATVVARNYAKAQGSFMVTDSPAKTRVIDRLKQDVIDLLVSLRSEKVVCPLIRLMWTEPEIGGVGREMLYPGTRALVTLGSIAVPELVASIENAGQLAYTLSQEHGGRHVESIQMLIQVRATIALEHIGDVRALPALRILLATTNDEGLLYAIKRAIAHIEK
jgi:hypothetical protein